MSSGDPELDELLAPMRDGPIALSSTADVAAQRERLLRGLRQDVREVPSRRARARRRTALWSAAGALAAAGVVAIGIGRAPGAVHGGEAAARADALRVEPLGHESAAWIGEDGMRRSVAAAAALEGSGELVAAPESWSRLSTPQGVRVELAPRTRLRVREAARDRRSAQLNLVEGEVHCDVPKLGAQAQFSITTPDARVIVHGTRFSVRVGGPDRPGTCVRVSEGLVEVRSGRRSHAGNGDAGNGKDNEKRTMLPPGTQWGCEPAPERLARAVDVARLARTAPPAPALTAVQTQARAEPTGEPSAEPAPRLAARRPARAMRAAQARAARRAQLAANAAARASDNRQTEAGPRPGTLAEENRLLAAALTAERSRDAQSARTLFEQLLSRNPGSPLAPEARAGLARLDRQVTRAAE
jgi:hypothetical protein